MSNGMSMGCQMGCQLGCQSSDVSLMDAYNFNGMLKCI
jgi:hypothetical protein